VFIWENWDMGTRNVLWNLAKKYFTFGLIGLTVSDRYSSIVPVRGASMSPTFNPHASSFTGIFLKRKIKQCAVSPGWFIYLFIIIISLWGSDHRFSWAADDYVLVEKFCLEKYKFSHGDVVVFRYFVLPLVLLKQLFCSISSNYKRSLCIVLENNTV
jgi:inner membrane protease subunit 2